MTGLNQIIKNACIIFFLIEFCKYIEKCISKLDYKCQNRRIQNLDSKPHSLTFHEDTHSSPQPSCALEYCCGCLAGKACKHPQQERSPARGRRIPAAGCNGTRWKGTEHRAGGVRLSAIHVLGKYCVRIRINAAGCLQVRGRTLKMLIWKDLNYSADQT